MKLELKVIQRKGKLTGTVEARTEAGDLVHADRSDDWSSAAVRDRFGRALASKAYEDPPPDADEAKAAEVATQRDAARRDLDALLLAELEKVRHAAELAAKCGGVEDAPVETRRNFTPDPANVVEYPEPLRLAEHYLKANARDDAGRLTLRRYRAEWWRYAPGVGYSQTPDETLDAGIYRHLDKLWTPARDKDGNAIEGEFTKLVVRSSPVREVHLALPSRGLITEGEMPQWLDGRTDPAPADVIAFKNGLLDADAYCRDENAKLIPLTPHWFSGVACPYAYDPTATCPTWVEFLNQAFEGDHERVDLLQEWMGYLLVADNRHEALMMLVGKPRAGKGTTIDAITAMLGGEQIASTSFTKIAGRFGLHPLLGKLAAVMPDAHVSKTTDSKQALEVLKSITGNDDQAIDRKGVDELPRVRLPTRFTIAVNELPQLPDEAGALKPRLKLLYYGRSFAGQEDRTLKSRIKAEAQGIATWSLRGLYRLRELGGFTEPAKCRTMLDEFEKLVSPVKSFAADHLEIEATCWEEKARVYAKWCEWCKERGDEPGNVAQFGQQLVNAFPDVKPGRRGPKEQRFTTYDGLRLC